jgi:hypothetical protein
MAIQMVIRGMSDHGSSLQGDRTPDRCPICQFSITPIDWTIGAFRGQFLERVLQCPNASCMHLFLARYRHINGTYVLEDCVPSEIVSPLQTPTIQAISEDFCKIYDEAYKAERHSLRLIAGPGYRKALEFLIKDYIVSQLSENDVEKKTVQEAVIEKMPLAACIEQYIKSEQIRGVAKRAAWLGNDETHYVRKWEGRDLEDLKKLITLTLHWIEAEKLTADVISDMPEAKAKPAV